MGEVYVRMAMGVPHPRVALLSNGTEDNKGTAEIKEANENLRKIPEMNFIGNIEGNQVFEGAADVVVTDGFTGNILLKVGEGVALELLGMLRSEISKDLVAQLAAKILMPVFRKVRRRVDYEEYGGVPVLGVNGVMINCHGRSKAKAVTNGILTARRVAREGLLEAIGDTLHQDSAEVGRRRRRIARALHLRQQRRSEAAGR
jgi:glycerol-3-phosphate acyltransferase PlsX